MNPDELPLLIPYFAKVARSLARGHDAEDLTAVALLSVWLRWDAVNSFPDARAAARRLGVWSMLADRRRASKRALQTVPIDGHEHATHDERDHFEELIRGDALLRQRYGQGLTLKELAAASGTTPGIMQRQIEARLREVKRAAG